MKPAAATSLATPQQLGRYRVIGRIGRGGMAEVYLAVLTGAFGVQKLVVAKVLQTGCEDPEWHRMFLEEARLATRMNHPNIVQTIDVGDEGGRAYMVMEYLEGQSLSAAGRRGTLSLPALVTVLGQALAGLHYMHELKDSDGSPLRVVHRDVSPQNIFVTYDGQVKVIDFGIAKSAADEHRTATGVVKGKIKYVAPEQIRAVEVDRRVDVFAAGIVLWEALAGRPIVPKGLEPAAVLAGRISGPLPSPLEANPQAPPELAAICMRALAFDRDARFPTAAAFQDALEAYSKEQGGRVEAREIGAVVAAAFAEERRQIQSLVDAQLVALKAGASVPLVSIPHAAQSSSQASGGDSGSGAAGMASTGETGSEARLPVAMAAARTSSRRSLAPAVLGAAMVLVLAAASFVALRRGGEPSTTATAGPSAATPAGGPVPRAIEVAISASPSAARLMLDGAPLPTNPYTVKAAADHSAHKIDVVLDGSVSATREITYTSDLAVNVVLEPVVEPAPSRLPAARPAAAKPARTRSSAPAAARAIDDNPPF